jgi:uncharacterized paraquat-inducible protein A
MSVFGPKDSSTGGHPARRAAPMVEEDPRRVGEDTLGHGTLACPRCDAPVALPGPTPAAAATGCPFCGHRGTLGSFVSLARPTRPTRIVVRVSAPAR